GMNFEMENPILLTRMRDTSYAVPKGLIFRFVHSVGCENVDRDGDYNRFIEKAEPKNVSGLLAVVRGLFGMMGCEGCEIDKDCSAGILFKKHSQNESYEESTVPSSINYMSIMSPRSSAVKDASWPFSDDLGHLSSGHRAMYGPRFKLDDSQDGDFVPR